MSLTLFRYITRDLLVNFLMALGVLAGIMSFGGLLRPLTEHGLDADQVLRMLGYLVPGMSAYSLPIAALFATTMVYGRLGADNEITACRAAGISSWALALPAIVLGLTVAILSLVALCFFVPAASLKVEQVIYSNLAGLVANEIERKQQIRFEQDDRPVTVFASGAQVLDFDPNRPDEQGVRLFGPVIATFRTVEKEDGSLLAIPVDFYTAESATAFIRQNEDSGEVTMSARLDGGVKLPRSTEQGRTMQVSVQTTNVGPIPLPSPVSENPKFMDVNRLRELLLFPDEGRRVRQHVAIYRRTDQQRTYLSYLKENLEGPARAIELSTRLEDYVLSVDAGVEIELRNDELVLRSPDPAEPGVSLRTRDGSFDVVATEMSIDVWPDTSGGTLLLDLEMLDLVAREGDEPLPRANRTRTIVTPMPDFIAKIAERTANYYAVGHARSPREQQRIKRELAFQQNSIIAELNARVSFSISCLILVLVGCGLGMMFSSGNFLSAFAVSVVPALLSIALIVTGQKTAENVPWDTDFTNWVDPLPMGLTLIWSGNAIVLLIAVVLLGGLQRK